MSKFYPKLTDDLCAFMAKQHIFFTATAPLDGRINLSPKGMSTFRCLDHQTVAYLDLTGSGNETSAHLEENGRLTIMFCSFTEEPLILRLYGQGKVIRPRDTSWEEMYALFEPIPGTRQIIQLDVHSVQTSCGYAVPLYVLKGERDKLIRWAAHKGEEGIRKYWHQKNRSSIDGLPTRLFTES